jgi:hypothetical protein
MVNTRNGGSIDLLARIRRRRIVTQPQPEMNPPPNPPLAGTDPVAAAEMQLLQQMYNTMMEMQAQIYQERQEMRQERQEIRQERLERQQLPPPPPPTPPWDKHREFMSHKTPSFSSSPYPLQVDDWLKTVDKMLNIAQCTDREKVLYASGCLTGPAADWRDSYCAAHAAVNTIT